MLWLRTFLFALLVPGAMLVLIPAVLLASGVEPALPRLGLAIDRPAGNRVYPTRLSGRRRPRPFSERAETEGMVPHARSCAHNQANRFFGPRRRPFSVPELIVGQRNKDVAAAAGERPAQGWAGPRN